MGLFEDMERVKLRFISVCERLLVQGKLTEDEFGQIFALLDQIDDYDDEKFFSELRTISKGISDFLDWDSMST